MVRRGGSGRPSDRPEEGAPVKRRRHGREDDSERYWRLRTAIEFVKLAVWTVLEALRDGHLPF